MRGRSLYSIGDIRGSEKTMRWPASQAVDGQNGGWLTLEVDAGLQDGDAASLPLLPLGSGVHTACQACLARPWKSAAGPRSRETPVGAALVVARPAKDAAERPPCMQLDGSRLTGTRAGALCQL